MISGLKLREELRPVRFGFPNEDHIGVRLRFVRQQSDVRAAQYYRDAALPEPGRQGIRVSCARCVEGNGHQIGLCGKVHRFRCFIHVNHVPMPRHKSGQVGHRDLLEVEDPGTPQPLHFRGGSGDQQESGRSVQHSPGFLEAALAAALIAPTLPAPPTEPYARADKRARMPPA